MPKETSAARAAAPTRAARLLWPVCALALLAGCIDRPESHLEKAQAFTFERKPKEALAEYEEALKLLIKKKGEPADSLRASALKGAGDLCYFELQDLSKAVDYYRSLADRYPAVQETLEARANLADIFRSRLNDRRAAVAQLSAIVQTFRTHPDAHRYQYQAAKDYFELQDWNQVLVEAHVLQERYPNSEFVDDAQMLIAASYGFLAQREKAIEAYGTVVQRWPDGDLAPRAMYEQSKLYSEAEQFQKAVDVLVAALQRHPNPRMLQMEITRLRRKLALTRAPDANDWRRAFDHNNVAQHPAGQPHVREIE